MAHVTSHAPQQKTARADGQALERLVPLGLQPLGEQGAAICIDGVCRIPGADTAAHAADTRED